MKFKPSIFYDNNQSRLNLWWQGTIFLFGLFLFNCFLYFIDQRLLNDELLWNKPLKFEISIMIHFVTLAVLASLLSNRKRDGKAWRATIYAVVIAGVFEVLYILLQAARKRESHFNNETLIEIIMYGFMGIGALILVSGSFFLGYLLLKEYRINNNALLLSSALGLIIGSVLTLIVAAYLSSADSGYIAKESNENVLRLPFLYWYLDGKDLRIPHFFATHLMQILPLYGLWLTKTNVAFNTAKTKIYYFLGIYTSFVLMLFLIGILK